MLREYRLTNFKAFGETVTIPIRPLTLIFGANSSGKSSIFQSLLLLKQTLEEAKDPETALLPKGSLVDLGTYRDFVHRHETERDFEFGARFDLERPLILSRHESVDEADLDIRIAYSEEDDLTNHVLSSGKVSVGDERQPIASYSQEPDPIRSFLVKGEIHYHSQAEFWDRWVDALGRCYDNRISSGPQDLVSLIRRNFGKDDELAIYETLAEDLRAQKWAKESIEKFSKVSKGYWSRLYALKDTPSGHRCENFLPQSSSTERSLLDVLGAIEARRTDSSIEDEWISLPVWRSGSSFRAVLKDLVYLEPLRSHPERYYEFSGDTPDHVGQSGEYLPTILFLCNSKRPDILNDINDDLEQLDIRYQIDPAELYYQEGRPSNLFSLRLVDTKTGVDASLRDVGFGIGQVLPIVVQNRLSEKKTLLIEQPEIHLHPAHQAELGDMFIRSALREEKEQRNTILLETHSEHLMLRILRRIRETSENEPLPEGIPAIRPEDVAVLYVQPGEGDEGAQIIEIPVTADGDFAEKWPRGFFTERVKELF